MNKCVENHDGLCWKCLDSFNPKNITTIEIPALGYGGAFDEFSSKFQLCDDCLSKTNSEWWELRVVQCKASFGLAYEVYEYEKEINEFIESLPLAGQELFYNTFSSDLRKLEPQDWIDFTLGTLSEEKVEYYGLDLREEV